MPEYVCVCCEFKTTHKSKYNIHLSTQKHSMIADSYKEKTEVLEEKAKDILIDQLKSKNELLQIENAILKGQIEVYKSIKVIEPVAKPVAKPVADQVADPNVVNYESSYHDIKTAFIDYDHKDEELLQSIAEMREKDDANGLQITPSNVFDAFFHNLNNNLPYVSEYLNIIGGDKMVLSNLILQHFKGTIKVTEVYKKRFFLYSGGTRLSNDDSDTILVKVYDILFRHFNNYKTLMKLYYCWDSSTKSFDDDLANIMDMRHLLADLGSKLGEAYDYDDQLHYLLKELNQT